MTEKQIRILDTALRLFAQEGFNVVSTARIAQEAEVSEGLIFRHFQNKAGLLEAIFGMGQAKVEEFVSEILDEEDPRVRLEKAIAMPFSMEPESFPFWRLQFKMKWEVDRKVDYTESSRMLAEQAYRELGVENPAIEAELLLNAIEGITVAILQDKLRDPEGTHRMMEKKFLP